jgi:tetratricopeptide (TPR) repeat protein
VRVPALLAQAASGQRAGAEQGLAALEAQTAGDPDLTAIVALAWSRLGEQRRALELMRSAAARDPAATRGARLELASALLGAGDDAGVASLVAGLERDPALTPAERRSLADLRVASAVRVADGARERGDRRAAGAALDGVLRDYPGDPRALAALGRLLEGEGDAPRARAAFGRALAAAPGDLEALRGAVDAALALGDVADARRLAADAVRSSPGEPRAELLAGRAARRSGDDAEAMRWLKDALARVDRALGVASPAAAERGPALAASRSAQVLAEGAPRLAASPAPDAAERQGLRAQIQREIDLVRERHQPGLAAAFEARDRSGEPGLSALTELRGSVETELPVALRGRVTFHFAEVELDSGPAAASAGSRIGTGGRLGAGGPFQATGTELRLAYEDRNLAADVGMTPLGFPVQTPVGGLKLRGGVGPLALSVEGARRSVTDSVLSYAGISDPATHRALGGVVAQGGRADASLALGAVTLHAYGSYDYLTGEGVAPNQRIGAGAGGDVLLLRGLAAGDVGAGLSVAGFGYDRNLSFFTAGHGGYFSPSSFLHAGVPVRWRRDGALRWEVVAEPALHTFTQSSAARFPVRGLGRGVPDYAGSSSSGLAFDGRAVLGVAVGRRFDLSVQGRGQVAPEFSEVQGLVVLRYGGGAR